ncbi:hypothetical protein RSOL_506500 [Rhizoctonia solani AG-3 Rhs1AP]|uniref:Uncharacterized protein n=2 Tax=Rhizoctonia solani AG-3 TaxID=1086053 RepID=A0A074STL6_9AGAM|nr:hypothetical protein RSOL_506500 [Rhizoctonia solani AG-3 Rhs1AP]KEP53242.1 hypothetical protein V565_033570 [Rhizoctonia solani 123E]
MQPTPLSVSPLHPWEAPLCLPNERHPPIPSANHLEYPVLPIVQPLQCRPLVRLDQGAGMERSARNILIALAHPRHHKNEPRLRPNLHRLRRRELVKRRRNRNMTSLLQMETLSPKLLPMSTRLNICERWVVLYRPERSSRTSRER